MSIESAIISGFQAAAASDRSLRALITGLPTGNLSTLTTTQKASIVAAINELEDRISSFINDADDESLITTYSASKIEERLIQIRDGIIGGASAAYDTLLELQNEITSNDSEIGSLLTAVGNRVRFDDAQSLTSTEKQTARSNIGAASQVDHDALAARVTTAESDISNLKTTTANHTTLLTNAANADYAQAFNTALSAA